MIVVDQISSSPSILPPYPNFQFTTESLRAHFSQHLLDFPNSQSPSPFTPSLNLLTIYLPKVKSSTSSQSETFIELKTPYFHPYTIPIHPAKSLPNSLFIPSTQQKENTYTLEHIIPNIHLHKSPPHLQDLHKRNLTAPTKYSYKTSTRFTTRILHSIRKSALQGHIHIRQADSLATLHTKNRVIKCLQFVQRIGSIFH